MIELRSLSIRSGSFHLEDICLNLGTGQYGVLMGKTGHGKTTILEAICGLRTVSAGHIVIHGTDVTTWPPGDRQIGYVPQDLALFPTLRVRDHLEFALRLQKRPLEEVQRRATEMANMLGIEHLLARRPRGLSGGESQRVALGRALAFQPTMLLLDEPLSALDESTRQEMHVLLRKIKEATGVTVLHVTHNPDEAAALADCQFHLHAGKITTSA